MGPFTAAQAPTIARTRRTSGNARTTHANRLVELGLLRKSRKRPLEYSATDTGRFVYETLSAALPVRGRDEPQPIALLAVIRGASIDDLVGADDLVVALKARLRDVRRTKQATYRLERSG